MKNLTDYVRGKVASAKSASIHLALVSSADKNKALYKMADSLLLNRDKIINANKKDIVCAVKNKLSAALIDRLTLTEPRIESMASGLKYVACLKDPVGDVIEHYKTSSGLRIKRVRVPIGVIAMIYESRPNVTADSVGLCIKSGNAIVLRGGSEAINSNKIIATILRKSANLAGLPEGCIQFIEDTDRKIVSELIRQRQFIDCIIPRGGEGLINYIRDNSSIPVISHGKGVCHTYVDMYADLKKAVAICLNAKVQRPGVCNAMETLLVHKNAAKKFLPAMMKEFEKERVEVRGCKLTKKILKNVKEASAADWYAEYLDLIVSVKIVSSCDDAIKHIQKYGSHHSDAIVTENKRNAEKFLKGVDSAAVYLNASTRFTDGGEFGMGAEIGISTQKFHARGPMGLKELTSYKFIVEGKGQIHR